MAHYRKLFGAAVRLNTAIIIGEAVAGWQAKSVRLLMDSIHNLSDKRALVFVFLAVLLPTALSKTLLRSANVLNSIGLLRVSAALVQEASTRLLHPTPLARLVPVGIRIAAAGGNAGFLLLECPPGLEEHIQGEGKESAAYKAMHAPLTAFDDCCTRSACFDGEPPQHGSVKLKLRYPAISSNVLWPETVELRSGLPTSPRTRTCLMDLGSSWS